MAPSVLLVGRSQNDRERIRALNDELRQQGPCPGGDAAWVFTRGISERAPDEIESVIKKVVDFSAFDADNGERFFWKIDYYNRALTGGSPDPTDRSVTCRVLTVMLA